jgi:pimeloyl-ACP methyl ester carboxylesterase
MTAEPTPADELTIDVHGCAIHASAWGDPHAPAIALVHGSAAHVGWWTPIATELARDHRVIALDLSGHGDSGWREDYDFELWADEVAAVLHAFAVTRPILVGHSLGARVVIVTAAGRPTAAAGLMLLDPPLRRPREATAPAGPPPFPRRTPGEGRRFDTLDEAIPSFHLRPNEPILNRDRLLEVAAQSFRQDDDGGWIYKADPRVHQRLDDEAVATALGQIDCPIALVYGALSPVLAISDTDFAVEAHAGPTEVAQIRDAYHHLMFDHGPELVDRIRAFARAVAGPAA